MGNNLVDKLHEWLTLVDHFDVGQPLAELIQCALGDRCTPRKHGGHVTKVILVNHWVLSYQQHKWRRQYQVGALERYRVLPKLLLTIFHRAICCFNTHQWNSLHIYDWQVKELMQFIKGIISSKGL